MLLLAYAQASQQIKYFQYSRLKLKLLEKTPMSWGIIFNYGTPLWLKSKINTLKSSIADSQLEKSIIVSMIFVVANINCTGIKYFLNGEC